MGLRPADIYDVAPNMQFDIPLQQLKRATASRLLQCGSSGGASISPYANVKNIRLRGGWTTTRVAFIEVKTGATVELTFQAGAGVELSSSAAASCTVPLPALALQGMAGPIPVYGGIRPQVGAQIGAGVSLRSGGSTDLTLLTEIGGAPPSVHASAGFDSARFELNVDAFASATASVGLNAEVGIGAANAANLHASFGSSLDFTVTPGSCSWDLNVGKFSAGGQLGPFTISTPSTRALLHRNLWHRACGSPSTPPASSDVIEGSWDFPGIGTIRIEPIGPESFHGVAVTDITYQYSSCVLTPAGQIVWPTINGTNGSYRGNVYWAEISGESCNELGADPKGHFSVEGNKMTVCSTEPGGVYEGCFEGYRQS